MVDGRFFGHFFWKVVGSCTHTRESHTATVWRGHSRVGVTHVWRGHSHVGVTRMWKGHLHVGVTSK